MRKTHKMNKFCILALLLCFSSIIYSNNHKLSDVSTISVITCDSGEELYAAFGHTAIRVTDSISHLDVIFNYGTFDFNTPNFYLKFINGKLNYKLSAYKFKYFLPEYFKEKRSVIEQKLQLSSVDKQKVYDALVENYQPENRDYKYDFFYDNCATRVFFIIKNSIESTLSINYQENNLTFREHLHFYLINSPWTETGLNLLLGVKADQIPNTEEATFLPYYLMSIWDRTQVENKALVSSKKTLLDFSDIPKSKAFWLTPEVFFWLLLVIIALFTVVEFKGKKRFKIIDTVLFIFTGFIGLLLAYLWFITDHQVPKVNLNLLWAIPFSLILPFLPKRKVYRGILNYQLISLIIFIAGWFWLPQTFPQATLPFAIVLLLRTTLLKIKYA